MQLPDDFELSAVATLSHVGDRTPSWRHAAFWSAWEKSLSGVSPALTEIGESATDVTDPTATHRFEGSRHVGIRGFLVTPPAGVPIKAGLVSVHGYSSVGPLAGERERWEHLSRTGVACLAIRVRGFPGSAKETGVLIDTPGGWIGHGLAELAMSEDAAASVQLATWIAPQAVGDVVLALRALSRWMGTGVPMFLHGESLGAGLAVIAAARGRKLTRIDRLVLELPSLGDWPWRLDLRGDPAARRGRSPGQSTERSPVSVGYQVRELLTHHQQEAGKFHDALRLCDAVVHAGEVTIPTLCKLAERDEVVPAPSAAAVYNALGTDPGLKWRFIVPFGHFDGGLRSARRHAMFERAADLFLDPSLAPPEAAELFEESLQSGDRLPEAAVQRRASVPAPVKALAEGTLFGAADVAGSSAPAEAPASPQATREGPGEISLERRLTDAYRSGGRTLDDLPYTPEFDGICAAIMPHFPAMTPREIFHKLHNVRKAGRLPKLGRAAASKPAVVAEDEQLLIQLVEAAVGSTGQRDQLPYTPAFDRLVWDFNQRTARSLQPHEVWRLVATLSK